MVDKYLLRWLRTRIEQTETEKRQRGIAQDGEKGEMVVVADVEIVVGWDLGCKNLARMNGNSEL